MRVTNHGSIALVHPEDSYERSWLEEHTDGQWWAGALVVEPRCVPALLAEYYQDGAGWNA